MKMLTHLLLGCTVFGCAQFAGAQGTAFTYQGRLNDSGNPATGLYDLTFSLFDIDSGSSPVTTTVTNSAVGVTNGLFAVALDFGANFPGANRWLEIGVRTNGAALFTTILPRQPITPTPYAITASNLSGTLPVAQLSGTLTSMQLGGSYSSQVAFSNPSNSFAGNGTGLTNVNAATLQGLGAASFWKTNGNAGANPTNGSFLGTTDKQPLELRVNNQRALRLEPTTNGTPNIIGGFSNNFVNFGTVGSVIAGGGTTNQMNSIFSDFGTIGGGYSNQIGGPITTHKINAGATITGGHNNNIGAHTATGSGEDGSTIGGGVGNSINSSVDNGVCNTIAGGSGNIIVEDPTYSFIGGGLNNGVSGYGNTISAICGGSGNSIDQTTGGAIGGGSGNTMFWGSHYSTISGGANNEIGEYPEYSALYSTIGGGANNVILITASYCTIAGGHGNVIQDDSDGVSAAACTISGGITNTIRGNSDLSVIAGGTQNTVLLNSPYSVISGGSSNLVDGRFAIIAGGIGNVATNNASAAGSFAHATNQGAFVWADSSPGNFPFNSVTNNEFAIRATGGTRIVTAIDGSGNITAGVKLNPGDTSWSTISDRNAKKDFAPIDGATVLDKLSQVPVEQWRYKWESDNSVPHIGPMAQDFKHAFYPGRDDKSITTLEFDGVEMAAIEGLNQKLKDKDEQINDLKERLARLEKMMSATQK